MRRIVNKFSKSITNISDLPPKIINEDSDLLSLEQAQKVLNVSINDPLRQIYKSYFNFMTYHDLNKDPDTRAHLLLDQGEWALRKLVEEKHLMYDSLSRDDQAILHFISTEGLSTLLLRDHRPALTISQMLENLKNESEHFNFNFQAYYITIGLLSALGIWASFVIKY